MREESNKFGNGKLYEIDDLRGKHVHVVSAACLSTTSDLESFISSRDAIRKNIMFVSKSTVDDSKSGVGIAFIVLGCQVTDLAILNDIKKATEIHERFPDATIYIGGCLAYRFDIELPDWCKRMETIRKEYNAISLDAECLVEWAHPFWTNDKGIDSYGEKSGDLFRNFYPLKIGAGCNRSCKYCTIKYLRGKAYETDAYLQVQEFLDASDNEYYGGVVLVSDNPTDRQVKDWCHIAKRYNKEISFRNVEPFTALACRNELLDLAEAGLLKIFHCPIQSENEDVLRAMRRDVDSTLNYIALAQELRKLGVKVATNIIIDYIVDGEVVHNMNTEWLNEHFDYWVWNPYFDGEFSMEKAEKHWNKYILGES